MAIPVIDEVQDEDASWKREGFAVYTTEQLMDALARGERVVLPDVDASVLDLAVGEGVDPASLSGEGNPVVSIECVGEKEVQCISVDDPDHLYLTDGLIPTHNTANIVFLKSTDDSMLDTLEKMSGKTHETYLDSKMVTRDVEKPFLQNAGTVSYTANTVERPVITYTDLAFLPERNSIMFIASHPCVWNRNETILPMSWRLYGKWTIHKPGTEYTLQTIPTLSSAVDFDVRANQPDFEQMLDQRIKEARYVDKAKEIYKAAYRYTDYEISKLDEDVYADAIMNIVDELIKREERIESKASSLGRGADASYASSIGKSEENTEMIDELKRRAALEERWKRPIFAGGGLSRASFCSMTGVVNHQQDDIIISAFKNTGSASAFSHGEDAKWFDVRRDGGLQSHLDSRCAFIESTKTRDRASEEQLKRQLEDDSERVHAAGYVATGTMENAYRGFRVTDEFLRFLAGYGDRYKDVPWATADIPWPFVDGMFEKNMARAFRRKS